MRKPEFENLLSVLRCERPERPTLFEFFLNGPLYQRLAGRNYAQAWSALDEARVNMEAYAAAGYDYITVQGSAGYWFKTKPRERKQSYSMNDAQTIEDWKSFEAYEWEDPAAYSNAHLDAMASYLPDGLKIIVYGPCGVMENVIKLVGYDTLCMMMFDDPALAEAIFREVGTRLIQYYSLALPYKAVGAIISNDDWGFNTQTFFTPAQMEKYVYPYHRKIVALAREHGKPAILHSCGNFDEAMEPVIAMGFGGKHSYEDVILPVEQAYDRWGGRIAILGGIDLNFIVRSTPDKIYDRSKKMLAKAFAKGGYALGTGNSVPEYVPQENYMAMIRAATE